MRGIRWLVFGLVALTFFGLALSSDFYNLTSPPALSWHVALRKAYSIVAFAAVGAAFTWAAGARVWTTSFVIAAYSGAIEIGQHLTYGLEPLIWNFVDVVCGGVGGALGALIPWNRVKAVSRTFAARTSRRRPRV